MSRTTVRAAIQSYLDPANSAIPYLGKVYAHPAKFTPEGDFYGDEDPGTENGAVIYIYLARSRSKRLSLQGAPAGGKVRDYELVLNCFIRSNSNQSETCGIAADAFLDALVTRIEADKTAGNPSVIKTWGEGDFPGAPDIEITALYPRNLMGRMSTTQVYAQVRLTVQETT